MSVENYSDGGYGNIRIAAGNNEVEVVAQVVLAADNFLVLVVDRVQIPNKARDGVHGIHAVLYCKGDDVV